MPDACVIPELIYRDVGAAVDWLCDAFGFTLRLRIGDHRAQLNIGAGAVVLVEARARNLDVLASIDKPLGVMVRVDDVEHHYQQVLQSGASVLGTPTDYPYGERQYSCRDLGGYVWTFSETIADIPPETWGGTRT